MESVPDHRQAEVPLRRGWPSFEPAAAVAAAGFSLKNVDTVAGVGAVSSTGTMFWKGIWCNQHWNIRLSGLLRVPICSDSSKVPVSVFPHEDPRLIPPAPKGWGTNSGAVGLRISRSSEGNVVLIMLDFLYICRYWQIFVLTYFLLVFLVINVFLGAFYGNYLNRKFLFFV